METFMSFLLKEWAGAPLAIWFGGVAVIALCIIFARKVRIEVKSPKRRIIIQTDAFKRRGDRR